MRTETRPRPISELTEDQLEFGDYLRLRQNDATICSTVIYNRVNLYKYSVVSAFNAPVLEFRSVEEIRRLLKPNVTNYSIVRDVSTECAEDDEANNLNYHPLAE